MIVKIKTHFFIYLCMALLMCLLYTYIRNIVSVVICPRRSTQCVFLVNTLTSRYVLCDFQLFGHYSFILSVNVLIFLLSYICLGCHWHDSGFAPGFAALSRSTYFASWHKTYDVAITISNAFICWIPISIKIFILIPNSGQHLFDRFWTSKTWRL